MRQELNGRNCPTLRIARRAFPPILRSAALTLGCCMLWLGSVYGQVQAPPDKPTSTLRTTRPRPNVLLILADDLGFADLGCYGGEIATPQLDQLAARGLRFTQAYNTARCWPSRAALLSGYYAQQVRRDALPGVGGGGQGRRPPWAKLLPEYLRPLGYRNYHSGKWHIDGPVLASGFDESLDVRNQGNYFSPRGNTLDDQPLKASSSQTSAAEDSNANSEYYVTEAIVDHAINCLESHAAEHADRPFFQYVAFIAPHFPLHALASDIDRYRDRYQAGWDELRVERHARQLELKIVSSPLGAIERNLGPPYPYPEAWQKLGPGEVPLPLAWNELTAEQQRFQATKMAIHAAMVDRMDQEIGRLVTKLRDLKMLDNTLIVFASDNGASAEIMVRDGGHDPAAAPGSARSYLCLGPGFSSLANTPFRRHKTWVHEGGISTPLIMHWPAGITAQGDLRHCPVHLIDFVPTILDLVGAPDIPATVRAQLDPLPPAFPGLSWRGLLSADEQLPRDSLWWLHEGHRAIRVGDWKLVAARDASWELYNLAEDRAEQHDLAPQQPDRVAQLAQLWEQQTAAMQELVKQYPDRPRNE